MDPIPTDRTAERARQEFNDNSSIVLFSPLPAPVLCRLKMKARRDDIQYAVEHGAKSTVSLWARCRSTASTVKKPVRSQAEYTVWIVRSIRSFHGSIENEAVPIGSMPYPVDFVAVPIECVPESVGSIAYWTDATSGRIHSILHWIQFMLGFMRSDADQIRLISVLVITAAFWGLRPTGIRPRIFAPGLTRPPPARARRPSPLLTPRPRPPPYGPFRLQVTELFAPQIHGPWCSPSNNKKTTQKWVN